MTSVVTKMMTVLATLMTTMRVIRKNTMMMVAMAMVTRLVIIRRASGPTV